MVAGLSDIVFAARIAFDAIFIFAALFSFALADTRLGVVAAAREFDSFSDAELSKLLEPFERPNDDFDEPPIRLLLPFRTVD